MPNTPQQHQSSSLHLQLEDDKEREERATESVSLPVSLPNPNVQHKTFNKIEDEFAVIQSYAHSNPATEFLFIKRGNKRPELPLCREYIFNHSYLSFKYNSNFYTGMITHGKERNMHQSSIASGERVGLIGRGSYAAVKKFILFQGNVLAIKSLRRKPEELDNISNEVDFLTRFGYLYSAINICPVVDIASIKSADKKDISISQRYGKTYLVMKYFPYPNFTTIICPRPGVMKKINFSNPEHGLVCIIDFLRQTQKVHAQGFIHYDIYGKNVLVDLSRAKMILIDFGSVKRINSTIKVYPKCPDPLPYYFAPELKEAHRTKQDYIVDLKADVFALGFILLYLKIGIAQLDDKIKLYVNQMVLHPNPSERVSLISMIDFFRFELIALQHAARAKMVVNPELSLTVNPPKEQAQRELAAGGGRGVVREELPKPKAQLPSQSQHKPSIVGRVREREELSDQDGVVGAGSGSGAGAAGAGSDSDEDSKRPQKRLKISIIS